MENNGPIFIGGLDRCGKTTLRAMLVSHPNIAIPEIGSNYWTFFYGQYGDLGKKENFERCLKAMLKYTHVTLLNPDVERIRRDFWLGEPTYARLFGLFNKQYAEQRGKPRWGDQTGLIERYADHVFSAYPGSKMIHMLRDPRDRYEASLAYGIPGAISSAMCSFPTVKAAVDTVIQTIQSGIPVARIELADSVQMDAINKVSRLSLPVAPTLWLEFHGTEAGVAEQAEMVQAIASEHGGADFAWTANPEERKKLWQARHDAAYANKALRQGAQVWATDVCVPISRLAECIVETQKDVEQSFIPAPIVGHVGDGNFHLTLVLKPEDPKEVAEADRLNDRLEGCP